MSLKNELKKASVGFLLLITLHFVAFFIFFGLIILLTIINNSIPTPIVTYITTNYRWLGWLLSPGLTQLIYVIPLIFWLKQKQRLALMKGVIIGAIFTALANGGCFFLMR